MSTPNTVAGTASTTVWDCINESILSRLVPEGTDRDVIGFYELQGVEVHLDRNDPQTADVRVETLEEHNIDEWLDRDSLTRANVSDSLRLKLLIGYQAVPSDTLRPPNDAGAVRFSRQRIYTSLGIPPMALEKMSSISSWMLEFPRDSRFSHSVCYGLGSGKFSAGWGLSDGDSATRGMMVFFRGGDNKVPEKLLENLKALGALADISTYFPFTLLSVAVPLMDWFVSMYTADMQQEDVSILRLTDYRTARRIFSNAHIRSGSNASAAEQARNLLVLAQRLPNMPQRHLHQHGVGVRRETVARNREINGATRYLRQYLEVLIQQTLSNQEMVSRQLETAQQQLSIQLSKGQHELAQASRRDQEVSTEIARVSRDIAKAAQKDGTSMKILSVVALLYLPAATMASIFAMPLFNWDAKHSSGVVSPKIWVYVVSTLVVTASTVGCWWLWLRRDSKRSADEKESRVSENVTQSVV